MAKSNRVYLTNAERYALDEALNDFGPPKFVRSSGVSWTVVLNILCGRPVMPKHKEQLMSYIYTECFPGTDAGTFLLEWLESDKTY